MSPNDFWMYKCINREINSTSTVVQQQCQTCRGSNADHHLYRAAGGRLHFPPARDAQAAVGRRQGGTPNTHLLLRCSSPQLGGGGLGMKRLWILCFLPHLMVSMCLLVTQITFSAQFFRQNQRLFLFSGSHPFSEAERKQLKNETNLQVWRIFITVYHQKAYFCNVWSIKVCQ